MGEIERALWVLQAQLDMIEPPQPRLLEILAKARAEVDQMRAQAEPVGMGGDKATLRVVTESWRERE